MIVASVIVPQEGDRVIKGKVQIIKLYFRTRDSTGHIGKDKFIIYSPGMETVTSV